MIDTNETISLSAHTINMAMNCTFKYYLYKNGKSCPIEETKYISCGQAVHRYMEDLATNDIKERMHYLNADYVTEGMREWNEKESYIVPSEMYDRFDTCVENGTNWYSGRLFDIEVPFEKNIITPKGRKVLLRGRIDAQDEEEVIDWKTGSRVRNNQEYIRQAHVYDYATDFKKKVKFISLLTGETLEIKHSKGYVPALCDEVIDKITDLPMRKVDRSSDFICNNFCENYRIYCSPGKEYIRLE